MISITDTSQITNSIVIDSFVEDGFDWLEIYEQAIKEGDLDKANLAIQNIEIARNRWTEAQG